MDSARTAPRPPPFGPPPPNHHHHHLNQPQPQPQQQQQPQPQPPPPPHPHPPAAPPNAYPTAAIDTRNHPPFPPPAQAQLHQTPPHIPHHLQQQQPQQPPHHHHQQPQQQHPHTYPSPGAGPALPPIHPSYTQAGASQDQNNLPPFRPPQTSHPSPHDAHEPSEYYKYGQHNRSGHATPAPVNQRSYSHDSTHHQHTPTTPAQPGPYPAASAPDGVPTSSHHMEHVAHQPYPPPNGLPHHGISQQLHGPPHPPPPPPPHDPHSSYAVTPVEGHHSYPVQHHGPQQQIYQPSFGPASNYVPGVANKRKPMRAQQACEQCRQRKQKCDEGNPCSFCKEQHMVCNYRDTPPAKVDKNMEKVIAYLEMNTNGIEALNSKIDDFNARLQRVESAAQSTINNNTPTPPAPTSALAKADAPADASADTPAEAETADESPVTERKQSLHDHRTGPHKLILLWMRVRSLFKDADVNFNETYVMEAEDRGILRLYGRGEGIDDQDGTQPGGAPSPAQSEDSADSAPTPREGLWGRGFVGTSHPDQYRPQSWSAGGLRADGTLDLDANTVSSLFDSYMKHIHVMHPFLDKSRIRRLFDKFIQRYSPGGKRTQHSTGFAVNYNGESERPMKRQRSNGSTGLGASSPEGGANIFPTERSPANAIVYLVLALGKICAYRQPLPGVVPDGKAINVNQTISHSLTGNPGFAGSSPIAANIKASPVSPHSTPNAHVKMPDSRMRMEPRSRRSSSDGGSGVPPPKNMDIIPGIAYYAKAAEILGDQGDGNDLVHAQMFLLAGLYKGQLARVKESMSWLSMAGRVCQTLLDRYKLYNHNYWASPGDLQDVRLKFEAGLRQIKDKRHNLIVLASWSCLQLESDILAELKLPSSGIQNIEDMLLMPHNFSAEESYDNVPTMDEDHESYNNILVFYVAQMFLRKRLNQVHREMYGHDFQHQPLSAVQAMIKGHQQTIQGWRKGLPALLQWRDSDPPASEILPARLRAKYWGAVYVIHRPFLDYALHIMPFVRQGRPIEEVAIDANGKPRDMADIVLCKAIGAMGDSYIWDAAKQCVDAALHSTVALDGVPPRLVMTNIHGTAHAQFGNMLVLAATYNTPWIKDIVPADGFQAKLERTIQFLRRLSPISPTANIDCSILEKVQQKLFGPPSDAKTAYQDEIEPPSASNSFSY